MNLSSDTQIYLPVFRAMVLDNDAVVEMFEV